MFETDEETVFIMVKPDAYGHLGSIITDFVNNGLEIKRLKMGILSPTAAAHFSRDAIEHLTSDAVVGIEFSG